ncbi:MAG: T9SS type A sorting domain-containing protein [Candidatus Aegiribacteria sp.]|nr:T9SS type A sorting domain-containing protein [Candidatus Aegiribacteria sp.]
MKLFTLLIVLFAATFASGEIVYRSPAPVEDVLLVESMDNSKLIEFNLSALERVEIELEDFGAGSVFRIPSDGCYLAALGSPDLPVIRRMVLIPSSGNIELEIVSEESRYLGKYNVAPFQQPPTYSAGVPSPYSINSSIYGSSQIFPASSVELESINILRDIRVAWIRYNPVRMNPVTGDVSIVTSVVVNVKGIGGSGENELARSPQGYTRSFLSLYDEVIGFDTVRDTDVVDGSYVFIGTQASIDKITDLISWKKQKGYNVVIGLVPTIGATSAAIDTWLETAYNTWPNKPEYIMLVGDQTVVPTPHHTGPTSDTHAADNKYAVVGSGAIPSMNIGRICGNHIDDLEYIAWKIVQHEKNPYQPAGSNWFMKAFSMACPTQPVAAAYEALMLHQFFQANGMESTFYCDALGGVSPTRAQIIADINDGRQVISYIGHGLHDRWVTSGFSNTDIAALTNGRKMPWVLTVGCQNGEFDNYYCFCEAFLSEGTIAEPKGAIAIMGSTTNSWIGPSDTLQIHTYRGYFTENLHNLGAAHAWGKARCNQYFGNNYGADQIMMATLFGDPETDIYNDTAPLTALTNTHNAIIPVGTFQVTVTDPTKAPVQGALVAAYYADTDTLLDSGYSNASGVVDLNIPTIPGGNAVTITSTAHNRYPAITSATPSVGIGEDPSGNVSSFFLNSPVPNPVTAMASIEFGIPMAGETELAVYDLSGRIVTSLETGELEAGTHSFSWNATSDSGDPVPNGMYFMKLTAPSAGTVTRSFLVLR